jgi:hypothetical protein
MPVQDVVQLLAEKEGYTEERWRHQAAVLATQEIDTVGNLRALSVKRIEALEVPPVVTEYLLRVKAA